MAPGDDEGGFLSRWSRRKAEVRRGGPVDEPPPPAADAKTVPPPEVATPPVVPATTAEAATPEAPSPAEPPPSLDEVAQLTPQSDFRRFVTPSVDPAVKNAALKKLFTDPHFNVMDGLDIYIDDYGKPDPLPEGMLRKMASAHALGLFRDEPADDAHNGAPADTPADTSVAAAEAAPEPEPPDDEDADLRLQPDDAADPGAARPAEPGAGEDAERER